MLATTIVNVGTASLPATYILNRAAEEIFGWTAAEMIRELPDAELRAIPAAALTACARSGDRAKSMRSGFEMHLAKPIDPTELVAAVGALARRSIKVDH